MAQSNLSHGGEPSAHKILPLRTLLALAIAIGIVSGTGIVQAAYHPLDVSRCLVNDAGDPYPDGMYNVRLKIFSGPTRMGPLWESDGPVEVKVESGCFQHVLGTSKPLPNTLHDYSTVWVGVSMGSGAEIWPRTKISTLTAISKSGVKAPGSRHTSGRDYKYSDEGLPDLYFHAGLSFGLGGMSTDETYKQIIFPYQPGTGVGYGLGLAIGFRNYYQLQFRPRLVTSSDLNAFQIDSVIPMDLHVRSEIVHKFNLLFFKKPNKGMVPCLFVNYGTASTGNVRHVDEVGSGFLNGSTKMFGLEAGILRKSTSAMFCIERRSATFRSFEIVQVGSFQDEIKATFWTVGFQISVGSGLSF